MLYPLISLVYSPFGNIVIMKKALQNIAGLIVFLSPRDDDLGLMRLHFAHISNLRDTDSVMVFACTRAEA